MQVSAQVERIPGFFRRKKSQADFFRQPGFVFVDSEPFLYL
jgi:hypothetical protein